VIKRGIFLEGLRNATVTGNTVENCWGEPTFVSTESDVQSNSFSNNAFVDYRQQPFSEGSNVWHEGYRGNYWGDYLDQHPASTCSSGDADVWDTPYSIGGGGNQDPYPLVCPPVAEGDPVVPAPPELASPAENSTTTSTAVELSWVAVEGATEYRVQVSRYASFFQPVVNTCRLAGTSYRADDLELGTTYSWRVLALTDGCHGPWSEVWTFTTGSANR
jgi:putative cofactor-binding repeat protein